MRAEPSKADAVRELAQRQGVVRPRGLAEHDLPAFYLHRLWQLGDQV